jgi:hypothetical protein
VSSSSIESSSCASVHDQAMLSDYNDDHSPTVPQDIFATHDGINMNSRNIVNEFAGKTSHLACT